MTQINGAAREMRRAFKTKRHVDITGGGATEDGGWHVDQFKVALWENVESLPPSLPDFGTNSHATKNSSKSGIFRRFFVSLLAA